MKTAQLILAGGLGVLLYDAGIGVGTTHFWIILAVFLAYGWSNRSQGHTEGVAAFREFVRDQAKKAGKIHVTFAEDANEKAS